MEIVLLERVEKLGQMGDVVKVKDGFARNYLLPKNKALRATPANLARFETEKTQLEARSLEQKKEAEAVAAKLDGLMVVLLRQASESAQLYGSVNARDIATAVTETGFTLNRSQVMLDRAIKALGIHPVRVALHPEVEVKVSVNVARSAAEAESQAAKSTAGLDIGTETEPAATEAESLSEDAEAPAIEELLEEPLQAAENEEPEEKKQADKVE